jgi:L-serine deaminase
VKRRARNLYQKMTRGFYPTDFKTSLEKGLQQQETSKVIVTGRVDHPLTPIAPRRVSFPTMDILACYAIAVNEMNAAGSRIVVGAFNKQTGLKLIGI